MSAKQPRSVGAGPVRGTKQFVDETIETAAQANARKRLATGAQGQDDLGDGQDGDFRDLREGAGGLTWWDRLPGAKRGDVEMMREDQAAMDALSLYRNADLPAVLTGAGGAHIDERLLGYMGKKQMQAPENALGALVRSAYDPYDPEQKRQMERLFPGLSESKNRDWQRCQEQRDFIYKCAEATTESLSAGEWQRLVRLIGGGEPLLDHPIDAVYNANDAGRGVWGGAGTDILRGIRAMFMFRTQDAARDTVRVKAAADLVKREEIAAITLQHFPRYMTGAYHNESENEYRARLRAAARILRASCERVVEAYKPIGQVAADVIAASNRAENRGRGWVMAPSWSGTLGAERHWLLGGAWGDE